MPQARRLSVFFNIACSDKEAKATFAIGLAQAWSRQAPSPGSGCSRVRFAPVLWHRSAVPSHRACARLPHPSREARFFESALQIA
ncbi:hypothetical protein [Thermaurantimonas aggregans]|uniref:hypothetical protein n=1 Tax=Thermaurantimonas aggregans TaxID=2173829 RepID=UPI0023F0E5B4|nr:hypothetical protein [Thermaurantimonas aggregans]MCX8149012.1 hypothetical protein [Thermaurantimonas aggregans]